MGEVFAGRYELADPIGRGGTGAVWRAWDHRRRRYVAAKVLQQSDAHALLRFVREQALRIDHPNVLAPASWAADDDKVLFTMDLVTGGSLVHLVGDYGPLPPAFVCTLLDQLLAGLAAVHTEGVVHRDVKPANVLLEATGTGRPRLRLSDFGIAMRLGEPRLTEADLVVGTPGYLAPEQMAGAEPDFPADLFAVGLVALYLLEGAKPDTKALVRYFTEHGTPTAPQGIPEPLWQVIAALLQPDPRARFRTATGARKALAAAAELLPEPGPDDEIIEIFDQVGPLPPGFGPDGPTIESASGGTTVTPVRGAFPPGGGGPPSRTGGQRRQQSVPGRIDGSGPEDGPEGDDAEIAGGDGAGGTAGAADIAGVAGPAGSTGAAGGAGGAGRAQGASAAGGADVFGEGGTAGASGLAGAGGPSGRPGDIGTGSAAGATEGRVAGAGDGFPHGSGPGGPGHPVAAPSNTTAPLSPLPAAPPAHPQFQRNDVQTPPPAPPQIHRAPAFQHPRQRIAHPSPYAPGDTPPSPRPPAPPPATAPAPHSRTDTPTTPYTAQAPALPRGSSPSPAVPRHRAVRRRRTGPPAKVTVPVLLLVLLCYAVGFWALSRL